MSKINGYICEPENCTLCMACSNACAAGAIYIDKDSNGYEKIAIDTSKCVDCGMCGKVCGRRGTVSRNVPAVTYAAQAKDREALESSASGGAFQMLAQIVLEKGGVCYGCTFGRADGSYQARHIRVDALEQLPKILNSKYIPSMIGKTFQMAKRDLEAGFPVLFSGTPCQIQGLRAYLNKEYANLLTADLICHGVTSTNLFQDYIQHIEHRDGIEIVDYCFRDKTVSWGTNFRYDYRKATDAANRIRTRHCPREASSYMAHYLRRDIFREACYSCTCSNTARVSDFTLGDYWEIEREHPEFITGCKPGMVLRRGISCILVNSEKGQSFVPALRDKMILHEVSLDSVAAHNSNLREASSRGRKRDWFLQTYREHGYAPIEDAYRNSVGKKMLLYRMKNALKSHMPDRVRIWIYRSPVLRRIVFHQ